MKRFVAPTEDVIRAERSSLAIDASAGSNVALTLGNNSGMAQYAFVVIGIEGSERAELQQVSAAVTPGTGITVSTLKFAHKAGEPVTVYLFDKRKFYGSLTEGGSYVELTDDGSPSEIQVDDPQGTLFEYTGIEGYAYFKSTYYNSHETTETDLADSVAVAGDQSGRYCSLYGIRKMAGLTNNPFITDGRVEDKRKQAENEIKSSLMQRYVLPLAEVPPLVTYLCELLAAGYIAYEEYGQEGDGGKKLGEARAILKSLQSGTQRLIGSDDEELAISSNAPKLEGYPDGSQSACEDRKFTMSKKF